MGGAGSYSVKLEVDFREVAWPQEVHLTMYAKETPQLHVKSLLQSGMTAYAIAKVCQPLIKRVDQLNNNFEGGRDDKFPPSQESIAESRSTCVDEARPNDGSDCGRYNNW